MPVQKADKKAKAFRISHFQWSFSSDIMAVKGLRITGAINKFLQTFNNLLNAGLSPSLLFWGNPAGKWNVI